MWPSPSRKFYESQSTNWVKNVTLAEVKTRNVCSSDSGNVSLLGTDNKAIILCQQHSLHDQQKKSHEVYFMNIT